MAKLVDSLNQIFPSLEIVSENISSPEKATGTLLNRRGIEVPFEIEISKNLSYWDFSYWDGDMQNAKKVSPPNLSALHRTKVLKFPEIKELHNKKFGMVIGRPEIGMRDSRAPFFISLSINEALNLSPKFREFGEVISPTISELELQNRNIDVCCVDVMFSTKSKFGSFPRIRLLAGLFEIDCLIVSAKGLTEDCKKLEQYVRSVFLNPIRKVVVWNGSISYQNNFSIPENQRIPWAYMQTDYTCRKLVYQNATIDYNFGFYETSNLFDVSVSCESTQTRFELSSFDNNNLRLSVTSNSLLSRTV